MVTWSVNSVPSGKPCFSLTERKGAERTDRRRIQSHKRQTVKRYDLAFSRCLGSEWLRVRTTVLPVDVEVLVFEYAVSAPSHVFEEPVSMIRLSLQPQYVH
jgi:hypothetical protein